MSQFRDARHSQREHYGNEHRMFVQGMMSHGIMNSEQVQDLFKMCCDEFNVPTPTDAAVKLKKFIICINNELDDLYLTIKKVLDENCRHKESFYVLCNKLDRSEDPSGLGKRAMVDFGPHELEFLRLIVEAILRTTEDRQLSQIKALILASEVKSKKMSQQEAEKTIEKLIALHWLTLSKNKSKIRLSIRFLAEMEPYLRDHFKDDIDSCNMCCKMVVRSLKCNSCEMAYHFHCLVLTAPDGRKSSKFGVCKDCKQNIPFGDFED